MGSPVSQPTIHEQFIESEHGSTSRCTDRMTPNNLNETSVEGSQHKIMAQDVLRSGGTGDVLSSGSSSYLSSGSTDGVHDRGNVEDRPCFHEDRTLHITVGCVSCPTSAVDGHVRQTGLQETSGAAVEAVNLIMATCRTLVGQFDRYEKLSAESKEKMKALEEGDETNKAIIRELEETFNVSAANCEKNSRRITELELDLQKANEEKSRWEADIESHNRKFHVQSEDLKEAKDSAVKLKSDNAILQQKLGKIQRQLFEHVSGGDGSFQDGFPSPHLLESTVEDVFVSIFTFSKLLLKHGNSDVSLWADSIMSYFHYTYAKPVYVSRPGHWAFFLKSCICKFLFESFEAETFSWNMVSIYLVPEVRVRRYYDYFQTEQKVMAGSMLGEYNPSEVDSTCHAHYEAYFRYNLRMLPIELRPLTSAGFDRWGNNLKTGTGSGESASSSCSSKSLRLVQSFVVAIRKVWNLHKLCLSFDPPATIFRVAEGIIFDSTFMESQISLDDDPTLVEAVGFMITPGFRVRKSVIKTKIYFSGAGNERSRV